jgi:hypothetical protein
MGTDQGQQLKFPIGKYVISPFHRYSTLYWKNHGKSNIVTLLQRYVLAGHLPECALEHVTNIVREKGQKLNMAVSDMAAAVYSTCARGQTGALANTLSVLSALMSTLSFLDVARTAMWPTHLLTCDNVDIR